MVIRIIISYAPVILLLAGLAFLFRRVKRFRQLSYESKYYAIMALLLCVPLLHIIQGRNAGFNVLVLVLFALIGPVGEVAGSWLWKLYFKNRYYYYTVDTLYRGFTSTLNFLPWALGGWLYVKIFFLVFQSNNEITTVGFPGVLTVAAVSFVGFACLVSLKKLFPQFFDYGFSLVKFFLIVSPFLVGVLLAAGIFGYQVVWLAFYFGIVGASAEYIFGKILHSFIGKKPWVYQYMSYDEGHYSLLNPLVYSIYGFLFLLVYYLAMFVVG